MSSVSTRPLGLLAPSVGISTSGWRLLEWGERILAATFLAVSSPLLIGAGIVVAVLSRRPPLVAHRRVAQGGRTLWVLKLRTMWGHADVRSTRGKVRLIEQLPVLRAGTHYPKRRNDPRVTSAFAAFCRRYSVDELPQLWHVVRGEMALVGPRPLTQYEVDRYYGPDAASLLSRRPGLSGLWQIRGRSRLNYRMRRRLDLFLIRKWCLKLYFRILLATLPRILSGKDAW